MESQAFSVIIKQINEGFTWAIVSRSEMKNNLRRHDLLTGGGEVFKSSTSICH